MKSLVDYLHPGTVYFEDRVYSAAEVVAGIDEISRHLSGRGIHTSPFVYLFAANHPKTVMALFGIVKAHCCCVLVDPQVGPLELAEMMNDTPPCALVRVNPHSPVWNLDAEVTFTCRPWREGSRSDVDDVGIMLYTAADDGHPKAAMLTHENILVNGLSVVDVDNIHSGSVSCALVRFSHLFGLQTGVIAPFLCGGSILIESLTNLNRMDSIIRNLAGRKVTNLYSVPVIYFLMSKEKNMRPDERVMSSYVSGGYKLSEIVSARFAKWSGREIHEGYGLTEASPICTWHRPADRVRTDSVGRAFPCCEVTARDEQLNVVATGQHGELCISGKNVMKGYYCREEENRRVCSGGLLRTGDRGYVDTDGFVHLTGLKKKMLNYAGQKVYIKELERLMGRHDNIEHVSISGISDWLVGQKVRADIRLKRTTREEQAVLEQWCRMNLSPFKVPVIFNYLPNVDPV